MGCRERYSPREEVAGRRVIGYHAHRDMPSFVIHSSPTSPDLVEEIDAGFYHLEQRYGRDGAGMRAADGDAAAREGDGDSLFASAPNARTESVPGRITA